MNGSFHDPEQGQRPRARRAITQSVYRRRRLTTGGIGLVFLVALAVLLGEAGGSSGSSSKTAPPPVTSTTVPPPSVTSTNASATSTATSDPGFLPPASDEPPTDVASVSSRMAPLWTAIQTGSLSKGMTVFFPESAYLQMKTGAISNPPGDYQNRLVALYNMDLGVYRSALGSPPSSAAVVSVEVDPELAQWVAPRTCANTIGYWHLPNIRISYSSGGSVSSFGVFSLISWRGAWYVVHLGPVPRTSGSGLLDLPASGPGIPGPGGGC